MRTLGLLLLASTLTAPVAGRAEGSIQLDLGAGIAKPFGQIVSGSNAADAVAWEIPLQADVQFRFLNVVHSVRRLWIMPFIRFLEGRRLIRPSWWLTSVHAGYELVSGGQGLTTTSFNVHIGG